MRSMSPRGVAVLMAEGARGTRPLAHGAANMRARPVASGSGPDAQLGEEPRGIGDALLLQHR